MLNKKGVQTLELIVAFVLAGLIIFIGIGLLKPTASEAGTFFSSENLKLKDSNCLFQKQREGERGIETSDIDKDDRPDHCDVCVCPVPRCHNKYDGDGDGRPRDCDKNDNDNKITICKDNFRLEDFRCIEKGSD
ncbi:hypothetical protein HYW99_01210 [Candidatus Woesearchaeota archaeon]|nr:hypothetical protein [Candidatus Woesearchaeota archaeon]